jgi:hypothetical protein
MALPDGRVVVIQRTYGFGRITISGIDVANRTMLSLGLPQADVFWNRILGRRADTPTGQEMQELADKERAPNGFPPERDLGGGKLISDLISMSQSAAQGLLLALLLFALYWVLAGPGGFALLRQRKLVKHSWLAFAATAALFTVVAWGGVNVLQQRAVSVKHVTFLDHLARPAGVRGESDPEFERAVSYFSVYLPSYGTADVAIESLEGQRDLLATWIPPGPPPQPFPNVDRYRVDVGRSPNAYSLPARATATQLYANWEGVLPESIGEMIYSDPEDPIRVVTRGGREVALAGSIRHDLPVPLTDVTVIWIRNNRFGRRVYEKGENALNVVAWTDRGQLPNSGHMWRETQIAPGLPFSLSKFQAEGRGAGDSLLTQSIPRRYIEPYTGDGAFSGPIRLTDANRQNYLEMLSMYHMLTPPEYFKQQAANQITPSMVARRFLGRELDLSAWFTRPCLIIMGTLEDSPMPIPFTVNDEVPRTEEGSRTIVRWIYPLPLVEDIAFARVETEDEQADAP